MHIFEIIASVVGNECVDSSIRNLQSAQIQGGEISMLNQLIYFGLTNAQ